MRTMDRFLSRTKAFQVSLVVSAGGGSSLCLPASIHQINMRMRDNNKDSFLEHIDEVVHSIEEGLQAEKKVSRVTLLPTHQSYQFDLFWQVLVHCQAGMSRSPAVVAAFLVLKR